MRQPTPIEKDAFIRLLQAKMIRPASLEDVHGTHHSRPIYLHPNTRQPFVAVK